MKILSIKKKHEQEIDITNRYGRAFVSMFIALLLTACSQEPTATEYTKSDVKLSKYNWRGELPEKSKVVLINRFGNITTRTTKQDKIEISGIIQRVGVDAPEPKVEVSDDKGVTKIEVLYDRATVDSFNNRVGRMDIGIYVPKGITVEMISTFGDIKSKKHSSNLIATSDSGKIKLQTRGTMYASTNSGDINAHLMTWTKHPLESKSKKKRKYYLQSEKGNVSVYFPSELSISLEAEAGKGVSTEKELFKDIVKQFDGSKFNFQFGNGERVLKAVSKLGIVSLNPQGEFVSQLSQPGSFEGDVRDLPKTKPWKPGDPVIEMQDGRSDKKGKFRTNQTNKDAAKSSEVLKASSESKESKKLKKDSEKESPI